MMPTTISYHHNPFISELYGEPNISPSLGTVVLLLLPRLSVVQGP